MLASTDASVRVIFLASPNNPTGVLVQPDELARFIAAVPKDVLVVLDQAYHHFVEPELRPDVTALLKRHTNLLVLRTFSKVYGLAGLRVGFGIGDPKFVSLLRRLQPPFSVNALAQAAALAALSDTEFVERSVATNRTGRASLCRELTARGFEHIPSHGNFVLVRVGDGVRTFQALLKSGIVVRPVKNHRLPEWIRVTVGLPHENAAFIAALHELLPGGTPR
jgi:histidinol-phosphate aminotransferase